MIKMAADFSFTHYGSADPDRDRLKAAHAELVASSDTSAEYEVDEYHLVRSDEGFFLVWASGCSCWDGDYSLEGPYVSVAEALAATPDDHRDNLRKELEAR